MRAGQWSILLMPAKKHAIIVASISLTVALLLVVLGALPSWQDQKDLTLAWSNGEEARCNRLLSEKREKVPIVQSLLSADGVRCYGKNGTQEDEDCAAAIARVPTEFRQQLIDSGCPVLPIQSSANHGIPDLDPPRSPPNLIAFAVASNRLSFTSVLIISLALFCGIFLLLDFLKRLAMSDHPGWTRLTIVVSAVVGILTVAARLYSGSAVLNALASGLAALIFSAAVVVYGRVVYRWVAEGFTSRPSNGPASVAASATSLDSSTGSADAVNGISSREDSHSLSSIDAIPVLVAAGFWPRLLARCVDLPVCWFSISILTAPISIRDSVPGMRGILLDVLVGQVILCAGIIGYDSWLISRFGTTPGKMLFGISVSAASGGLPSGQVARRRAWGFVKSGLYLGFYFPVVQGLSAINAWRRRHGPQPWDLAANTVIQAKIIGQPRLVAAISVAVVAISLMVGASSMQKELTKDEVRRTNLD